MARHATNKGVFEIFSRRHAGSFWFYLYCDGKEIAVSSFANFMAQTLARGGYDDLLGFEAARLSIPNDFDKWDEIASSSGE